MTTFLHPSGPLRGGDGQAVCACERTGNITYIMLESDYVFEDGREACAMINPDDNLIQMESRDGEVRYYDPVFIVAWYAFVHKGDDWRVSGITDERAWMVFGRPEWKGDGKHGPEWFRPILEKAEDEGYVYHTRCIRKGPRPAFIDRDLWKPTVYCEIMMKEISDCDHELWEWDDWYNIEDAWRMT
jgi:hypothetical protein